jgi:hypothetical protein
MVKYLLFLIIPVLFINCGQSIDREDINLMSIISHDQMQVNDNLVKSLRMHLEFYGAVTDEEEYYADSEKLWNLRKNLINENDVAGLLSYADSVESRLDQIGGDGDDYLDQLNIFYRRKITDEFDSLTYYKFLYTTLKKEYQFHSYNARMMRQ